MAHAQFRVVRSPDIDPSNEHMGLNEWFDRAGVFSPDAGIHTVAWYLIALPWIGGNDCAILIPHERPQVYWQLELWLNGQCVRLQSEGEAGVLRILIVDDFVHVADVHRGLGVMQNACLVEFDAILVKERHLEFDDVNPEHLEIQLLPDE
jgi:hypothetical protein